MLYRKREVMLIQVLSPDELYPEFDGRVHMMDSEEIDFPDSRNMRMIVTRKMVEAYQKAFDEYEKEIIDFCAARGVVFMTVVSDEPIESVFLQKGVEKGIIRQ